MNETTDLQRHEPTIIQEPDGRYVVACTACDWAAEAYYPVAALVAVDLCRTHNDSSGMGQ